MSSSMTQAQLTALLEGPAQKPPNGTVPNYDDPGEGNQMALGVTLFMTVLTGICVFLRAYAQIFVKKNLTLQDGLGFLGLLCYCALVWVNIRLVQLDTFFNHQWNFRFKEFCDILFALYILPTMFSFFMMFIKPAILIEWTRIFVPSGMRNAFWWSCVAMAVVNFIFYAVTLVVVQLYCTPHEKIWNRYLPGTCRDRRSIEAPSTIFNLILDILILVLPQKVIWKLQMNMSRKIGISVIFSVGLIALVAAAGRVHAAFTMDYTYDVTYSVGPTCLWSLAEPTCVMMVFCIPAIPKVFAESAALSRLATSLRSITVPIFGTSRGVSSGSGEGGSASSRWRGTSLGDTSRGTKSSKLRSQVGDENNSDVQLNNLEMATGNGGTRPSEFHAVDDTTFQERTKNSWDSLQQR